MTAKSQNDADFVPDWAKGIVWYQIFPERFRNGDPAIRNSSPALQRGDFTTLLTDDDRKLFAFERICGEETVVVIINRSAKTQTASLSNLASTVWTDVLNDQQPYKVRDSRLTVEISPQWGRILIGSIAGNDA